MVIIVKEWFISKIEKPNWVLPICYGQTAEVIRETEKAYQCEYTADTIDGEREVAVKFWIPKSCTITVEEFESAKAEVQKRFDDGAEKYRKMIEWCKVHGVKGVRTGLRKETVLKKISDSGLSYTY